MLDIIHLATAFDPATAELVRTAFIATATLAAGLCALALLPWTDAEIDEVDSAARLAVSRTAARLVPDRLVPARQDARITIQ